MAPIDLPARPNMTDQLKKTKEKEEEEMEETEEVVPSWQDVGQKSYLIGAP